jgi:transketolase
MTPTTLDRRSKDLRQTITRVLDKARRGHVGAAFSAVEILRVLYDDVLRLDPSNPLWPQRDRCILSKGHGCLALYVMLADKGFFPEEELWKFCTLDGMLGGHPERGRIPGVEACTGSLGHGLSIGIGFALHARYIGADSRVFVVLGDGECDEGSIWEGALCAGKHKLSNLTAVIDYNKHQSYSSTREVQDLEPFADKWRSFGFGIREVDGHSVADLRAAFASLPFESGRPSALICHTVKGKGAAFAENNLQWHHKGKLTDADIQSLMAAIEDA